MHSDQEEKKRIGKRNKRGKLQKIQNTENTENTEKNKEKNKGILILVNNFVDHGKQGHHMPIRGYLKRESRGFFVVRSFSEGQIQLNRDKSLIKTGFAS